MQSTFLCVFFVLIIHEGFGIQNDGFRPTPIPLSEWHLDKRMGRAGTLHESYKADATSTVATIPAHYWEDALRHSVYLTLVRDKIDQLIAKGEIIKPDTDLNVEKSKEVDDHDLWEKVKSAPFDRIKEEETDSTLDVTIVAKGRLVEEDGGFRFIEDDKSKEKCTDDKCMQVVKAIWSVKRVRQRDQEISPGKYHYELTFSVISQTPKKEKKPYENPIRTFTVKESGNSNRVFNTPLEFDKVLPVRVYQPRPTRAIWFHKNIVPTPTYARKQQQFDAWDRIFSTLFSDDDEESHEPPVPKYRANPYVQHSKIGHVGAPTDPHPQVNVMHYPYKPQSAKYGRPPLPAPPLSQIAPQRHHLDIGSISALNSQPYYNPYDHRESVGIKTTKPAILPTPLPSPVTKDQLSDVTNIIQFDNFENTTKLSEMNTHKSTNKFKITQGKINYFSDHIRPPIYNAPPGVFVTMDKKPFKPLPPLKFMNPKPHKANRPIDFRPSPQIHETELSLQDPLSDAFRPILANNYNDMNDTDTYDEFYYSKKPDHKYRKTVSTHKKPTKKHESTKTKVTTTPTPDIITAQSFSEDGLEAMDWMNYLGAFTKTTPLATVTERPHVTEIVASTLTTTEVIKENTSIINILPKQTSTPPTIRSKKRTRPPPKFNKQDKMKKHKRITPTSSTTTTIKPRIVTNRTIEKSITRKPIPDLTPHATSALTGTSKSTLNTIPPATTPASTTSSSSTSTTSTTSPTTTKTTTTTTTKPTTTRSTTTTPKPSSTTATLPRNRNRFRQSTLLIKGTSVKHDRWSVIGIQKNGSTTPIPSSSYRRKGSNFQGYSSTSTPKEEEYLGKQAESNLETSTTYENYETNSVIPLEFSQNDNGVSEEESESDEGEASDHTEFIFPATSTLATEKHEEKASLDEPHLATVQSALDVNISQNKTKCKKKKNNSTTESTAMPQIMKKSFKTHETTSENPTTNDIFDDLLNFNFKDEREETSSEMSASHLDERESINHPSYAKIDENLNNFFSMLDEDTQRSESSTEYLPYDEDVDELEDKENEDDEIDSYEEEDSSYSEETRHNHDSETKRPLSFLELLAMS